MDKNDGQESELEQELDQLYRKVAGQTPPETASDRKESEYPLNLPKQAGPGPVSFGKDHFTRGRGRPPFHIAPLGLAIMFAAFVLATAAVFFLTAVEHEPPAIPVVGAGPVAKQRSPGEGVTLKDKEGRPYPLPSGAVVLKMEEVKETETALKPSPAAKKEKDAAGLPGADISGGRPQGRYAVQIRAYPEDRRQEAIAFLEELRKRNSDAALETVAIAGRGVWHRILLGDFASQEQADDYRQRPEMARDYPNSFVQKRSGSLP